LSMNHAMLLEEIGKLRKEMAKVSGDEIKKTKKVIKAPVKKKTVKKDDLTVIEGVGPAIKKLLWKNDIGTFKKLSESKVADIREILTKAGSMFAMHDPATWAHQAKLANQKKWKELETYKARLDGGVRKENNKVVKKTEKSPKKAIKKIVKETVTYE
jgi:predicted flap endonuclease-1-like 5' DNA nuclease